MQAATIHGDVYIGDSGSRRQFVPRQLPSAPRHFTDRVDALAALDALRSAGSAVTALITGPAGVGKTSLGLRWLHEHSTDFPDGQLYVDLRGSVSPEPVLPSTVLPRFLRALGVPPEQVPADLAEQTALYRTVTAERRVAVLCDNAVSAAQVRPLIPAAPRSVCLVTSRWRLTSLLIDGAGLLTLEPLDVDSAVELLGQIAGPERVASEQVAAQELVLACGLFPLSVCVGAALLLTRPGWSVAAAADGLTTLRAASLDEEVSMTASLDQSYAVLSEGPARLYRRLGLHPGAEFGFEAARAVAATAPVVPDVDGCLTALVDANLLTAPGPDRYRFHDVIRQHALGRAEREETDGQRTETLRRIIDSTLATADSADHVLYPHRKRPSSEYLYPDSPHADFADPAAALAWFDREHENLLAVQRLAADLGLDSATWQLAEGMWAVFAYLRYRDGWIPSHQLAVAAAQACGRSYAEARLRTGLGMALRDADRHQEALDEFTRAMEVRQAIGDRRGEGLVLHNIAVTERELGDLDRARATFRTALAIREETDDTRGIAHEHSALGEVASLAGHHDDAVTHFTAALRTLGGTGGPDEARTERLFGEALLRSGDVTAAPAHLDAALRVLAATGDGYETGLVHEALGEAAERRHDPAAARDSYSRAEAVFRRLSADREARRAADRRSRLGPVAGP